MKKRLLALITVLCLLLSSCQAAPKERVTVRVATLSGPTGIGMVKLFENTSDACRYEFTVCSDPTEIAALVANGSVDIAALPTNLAANLYQKTGGKVRLVAVNTLGVLHLLDATGEIRSLADLSGKTVYATGEGSTPEYVLNFLLEKNGLNDVTVTYKAEHSELAALCIGGKVTLAVLPEPFVTNVTAKADFADAIDLSEAWEEAAHTSLPMGGVIATADFIGEHADLLDAFLSEYRESVTFVNANPKEAGALVEQYNILPSAAVAEKAIPNCNIVLITGEKMKEDVSAFYQVLFDADKASVGGSVPDDTLYYVK